MRPAFLAVLLLLLAASRVPAGGIYGPAGPLYNPSGGGGGGNVEASAPIPLNEVVVGADGAEAIKGSGTINTTPALTTVTSDQLTITVDSSGVATTLEDSAYGTAVEYDDGNWTLRALNGAFDIVVAATNNVTFSELGYGIVAVFSSTGVTLDPTDTFPIGLLSNNIRVEDGGCDGGVVGVTTICDDSTGTGDLSVRHGTGALVSLEAGGAGSSTFVENEFTPTLNQTVFTLSNSYVGAGGLSVVFINHLAYAEGTHYTISGTTLTWLDNPFTLDTLDSLVVKYQTS